MDYNVRADSMKNQHRYQPVIVAPTFNNAGTLVDILQRIEMFGIDLVVVDDGSTDATPTILQNWRGRNAEFFTHETNRGKAAALRTGFSHAIKNGYTHAITIDTDGQLNPAEIPLLLDCSCQHPRAMIIGSRDSSAADYPRRSRIGRWASNLLLRWEGGAVVSDSQCGYRVYPLQEIQKLKCRFGRYAFETEILVRSAWTGVELRQVNVSCTYRLPQECVSHFRPWRDSWSAVAMHLMLLFRAMWSVARIGEAPTGTIPRRLAAWLNPLRAWRAVRHNPAARSRFAAGLAVGVFIANLPIYGLQTAIGLIAARRLKLHPLSVLAGTHISTPPVGPLLIAAAISLGHWIIYGSIPKLSSFDPRIVGYSTLIKNVFIEWMLGGIICGIILAAITFCISSLLMQWAVRDTPADSTIHPAAPAEARDS